MRARDGLGERPRGFLPWVEREVTRSARRDTSARSCSTSRSGGAVTELEVREFAALKVQVEEERVKATKESEQLKQMLQLQQSGETNYSGNSWGSY